MSRSPYPVWYSGSDAARADDLIRRFTDAAFDHREGCDTCQAKRPCETLMTLIDEVSRGMSGISDPAFTAYCEAAERKYGHRDWRAS